MSIITTLQLLLPVLCLAFAFAMGPSVLAARGVMRPAFGADVTRARAPGLAMGVGLGAMAATLASGVNFGAQAASLAACLTFLVILAAMDLTWRWLPLEWTLPLLVLGLGSAALGGDLGMSLLGSVLGGGVLLILRLTFQILRGTEALGLGDVWLAAALGAFVGPSAISWLLAAAALLGIAFHLALRAPQSNRFGVAFGAHLCTVTPLFLYL